MWEVEYTDEFETWWATLSEGEQETIAHDVGVLQQVGPSLGRPHADTVYGSRFSNMKELRSQFQGQPYRTLFAFDPRRTAILLIGGRKTEGEQWYLKSIAIADHLYEAHLESLRKEGFLNG